MTTPAFLIRLMAYVRLSRSVKLGPEDSMCIDFATRLRLATIEGRLSAVWCHVPNQLANGHKTGVRAAIARAMGMHVGSPDYLFLWNDGSAVLEAKSGTGSLSPGQKDFRDWAIASAVPHFVFRTADEGEEILIGLGILSPMTQEQVGDRLRKKYDAAFYAGLRVR